jgi:hypothetical protein
MKCLDLNTCLSVAHNTVLKTIIIWYLIVMHMSQYLTGIDIYFAIMASLKCQVPFSPVGRSIIWLNLCRKMMCIKSRP